MQSLDSGELLPLLMIKMIITKINKFLKQDEQEIGVKQQGAEEDKLSRGRRIGVGLNFMVNVATLCGVGTTALFWGRKISIQLYQNQDRTALCIHPS